MTEDAVAIAFAQQGKWITRFVIDHVAYGGSFDAMNDARIDLFLRTFPGIATILELGSLEGGHTLGLARRAGVRTVLGVEGRAENLARARLAARLLEVDNVQFVEGDLEGMALAQFGKFDAIFCCGLLYHLPEPWKLVHQFAEVSPRLFLWTHYCQDEDADTTVAGYQGRMQIEGGRAEPLSGLSSHSFWPTLEELKRMLRSAGFGRVQILSNEIERANGPAVEIAAWAGDV